MTDNFEDKVFVPSLAEIAGNLSGTSNFVQDTLARLRKDVRTRRFGRPAPADFEELRYLVNVMAETMGEVGDAVAMYSRWERENGLDKPKFVTKTIFDK